jgi:hypothetical protein
MSDYIHSVISIEPLEAKNTICDIISCINDKDNISDIIETFYNKSDYDDGWVNSNIGCKKISISFDEENVYIDSVNRIARGFFKRLYIILSKIYGYDIPVITIKTTNTNYSQINFSLIRENMYAEEEMYLSKSDYLDMSKDDEELFEEHEIEYIDNIYYIESVYSQISQKLRDEKVNELFSLMYEWCLEAILTTNRNYPINIVEYIKY